MLIVFPPLQKMGLRTCRCGALYNLGPFYRELRKGTNPDEAWKKSKGTILQKRVLYGRWDRNRLEADVSDDTDDICRVSDIK